MWETNWYHTYIHTYTHTYIIHTYIRRRDVTLSRRPCPFLLSGALLFEEAFWLGTQQRVKEVVKTWTRAYFLDLCLWLKMFSPLRDNVATWNYFVLTGDARMVPKTVKAYQRTMVSTAESFEKTARIFQATCYSKFVCKCSTRVTVTFFSLVKQLLCFLF